MADRASLYQPYKVAGLSGQNDRPGAQSSASLTDYIRDRRNYLRRKEKNDAQESEHVDGRTISYRHGGLSVDVILIHVLYYGRWALSVQSDSIDARFR